MPRQVGVSPEAAELRLRGLLPRGGGVDHAGDRDAGALGGSRVQRQAPSTCSRRDGGVTEIIGRGFPKQTQHEQKDGADGITMALVANPILCLGRRVASCVVVLSKSLDLYFIVTALESGKEK